jgi:hypothetical protein
MSALKSTTGFSRAQVAALVIGALGVIASLVIAFTGSGTFFQSYLFSFMFWTGLSLGCLMLIAVIHMAGGSWGALILRPLEAGVAVFPLMALLFIPLLFGLHSLYPWTDADYVATHALVSAKSSYMNLPFFIIRNILYFAIWIWGALVFLRGGNRQDAEPAESGHIAFRLRRTGPLWIFIYVMSMTFAGSDWGMSLTPEWFSGIYSVILMAGQVISSMAFIIAIIVLLALVSPRVNQLLTPKRLQDLGNFLMASMMFWAYVHVSQLMIIWSNNTTETSSFYVARLNGAWEGVAIALTVFGFFAPFAILFSRWVKQKRLALVTVAVWAILMRFLDLYWIIIPSFDRTGAQFQLTDLLLLVGLGGLWLAVYLRTLGSRPIVPLHDPRLPEGVTKHA